MYCGRVQGAGPDPIRSPRLHLNRSPFQIPDDVPIKKIANDAKKKRTELPVWERLYARQVRARKTMVLAPVPHDLSLDGLVSDSEYENLSHVRSVNLELPMPGLPSEKKQQLSPRSNKFHPNHNHHLSTLFIYWNFEN